MTSPIELGLPDKFTGYRRGQLETALDIAASDKRFITLSAPTGCGKSLIYMSAAKLLNARTLILVSTKGLQEQLKGDFEDDLCVVYGKGNYECLATRVGGELSDYSYPVNCDLGPCNVGVRCSYVVRDEFGKAEGNGCYYYDAVSKARSERVVLTNYAYWLSIGKYADKDSLGLFDFIVLDECHIAPDILSDFCTVTVFRQQFKNYVGIAFPRLESVEDYAEFCKEKVRLPEEIGYMNMVERVKFEKFKNSINTLKSLSEGRDEGVGGTAWVIEHFKEKVMFSPVWPQCFSEDLLFRGVGKVCMVSATVSQDSGKYLGVEQSDSEYIELPSTFAVKKRPFVHVTGNVGVRVDYKMNEGMNKFWINRIDWVIRQNPGVKGIIHSRSYDRARNIVEMSEFRDRMITHGKGEVREAIERFVSSDEPVILVSPVVEEGYDFAGDLCRFQILSKVPFVFGSSPLFKARQKEDKGYSNYITARDMVQSYGRGVRSEEDWCKCYIVDDHWFWFQRKVRWPKWFKKAWQVVNMNE